MTADRYSRQTMLDAIGPAGQERIACASVLIVGLGGLGAPVATYLTGAGAGRIGLADADTVSESNLQRQTLYTEAQIGRPKTEAARERLAAMSSHTVFDLYPEGLTPGNADALVSRYDLVVDCCDNFPTRFLIDDCCARAGVPWIHGAIGEFAGQVSVFNLSRGVRYSDLYPDREAMCALPRVTAGVIGPVPGVIGAIQASEALKILAGFGSPYEGRLFHIDLLSLQTSTITF